MDSTTNPPKGLYPKYTVTKTSTGETVEDCFVIRLTDPHAESALLHYAKLVRRENPQLASDLAAWFGKSI